MTLEFQANIAHKEKKKPKKALKTHHHLELPLEVLSVLKKEGSIQIYQEGILIELSIQKQANIEQSPTPSIRKNVKDPVNSTAFHKNSIETAIFRKVKKSSQPINTSLLLEDWSSEPEQLKKSSPPVPNPCKNYLETSNQNDSSILGVSSDPVLKIPKAKVLLELVDEVETGEYIPSVKKRLNFQQATVSSPTSVPTPKVEEPVLAPAWIGKYRLLRKSDTIQVLDLLFKRLGKVIDEKLQIPFFLGHKKEFLEFSKREQIQDLLDIPIALSEGAEEAPNYRITGRKKDNSYVIFYQQEQRIRCIPIPNHHHFQVALLEGEQLLTDEELTELFQKNAKTASPEQAKETALKLSGQLNPEESKQTKNEQKIATYQLNKKPSTNNGLLRAESINERYISRLVFNRKNDTKNLWDSKLLDGISVFQNSQATLYVNEEQILEGLLVCVDSKSIYMVFDRRSKKHVQLKAGQNQKLWLRKQEK